MTRLLFRCVHTLDTHPPISSDQGVFVTYLTMLHARMGVVCPYEDLLIHDGAYYSYTIHRRQIDSISFQYLFVAHAQNRPSRLFFVQSGNPFVHDHGDVDASFILSLEGWNR